MDIVHLLRIFFYVFMIIMPTARSVSDAEALLRLKKSLKNTAALSSWNAGTDPCDKKRQWVGVVCMNDVVTGLRLGGMGLSGRIDVEALSQIPGLRTLALMQNSFTGPIPEFNQIGALKALYISKNKFSGEIPADFFVHMGSMKKIWLSDNKFTGPIPPSLAGLTRVMEIHLENNQFSGKIPEFKQKSLTSLVLSNNNLHGEIPASLSRFDDTSFKGNPGLCGPKIGKPCQPLALRSTFTAHDTPAAAADAGGGDTMDDYSPDTNSSHGTVGEGKLKYVSIGIMAASGVILALMVTGIVILKRRQEKLEAIEAESFEEPSVGGRLRGKMGPGEMSGRKGSSSARRLSCSGRGDSGMGDLVMVNDEKGEFGMGDLMKAAAEVIGNGTMGSSYKATMTNGTAVVVKRAKEMNRVGKDVFDVELRRLGGLRHRNILTPLAYHYRKDDKLMVTEFMPKGSLLYVLHGDRGVSHSELNWAVRLKIIKGIAEGLDYLHEELSCYQVPHGDLQSSNILLAHDYEPRLSDYGYVSLINPANAAQSLMAFRSPEALQFNQVSPKSDVYCLGIVILEVVTGKFPSQYLNNGNGGTDVVQWVKSTKAEGREAELFDPELTDSNRYLEQMRRLLRIGEECAESNPDQRLDLRETIRRIEEIQTDEGETKSIDVMPSLQDGYAEQIEEGRGVAVGDNAPVGSGNRSVSFAFNVS